MQHKRSYFSLYPFCNKLAVFILIPNLKRWSKIKVESIWRNETSDSVIFVNSQSSDMIHVHINNKGNRKFKQTLSKMDKKKLVAIMLKKKCCALHRKYPQNLCKAALLNQRLSFSHFNTPLAADLQSLQWTISLNAIIGQMLIKVKTTRKND